MLDLALCRLEMVNSAITPITTYAMCTIKLPKGVIDNIDRARKQCLRRGNDPKKKGGDETQREGRFGCD